MPNHYTTIAICSPGHDFSAERFNAECAEINLCEVVRPLPACLKGIVASSPPARYRHKDTGDFWVADCNGPEFNDGNWERVPLDAAEVASLKQSVGAADWYEWSKANWGTKWGTYDVKAFDLGGDGAPVAIKFQTAWCPPTILDEIAAWLRDKWGFERVVWIGFNPYDDSTVVLGGDLTRAEGGAA